MADRRVEAGDLQHLLTPVVSAAGAALEKVTITSAGRRRLVKVTVDLPEDRIGSLSLDEVADVSRAVGDALDERMPDDTPYTLEVSTPGVDRPLTERRHWKRARTRLVEVQFTDGGSLTGRLTDVGDSGITVDVAGHLKQVPWERVGKGRIQVEFNRPDGQDDEHAEDLGDG